jgi:hypothetical protein
MYIHFESLGLAITSPAIVIALNRRSPKPSTTATAVSKAITRLTFFVFLSLPNSQIAADFMDKDPLTAPESIPCTIHLEDPTDSDDRSQGYLDVPCAGTVVINLASPRPLRLWVGDLPVLDEDLGGAVSSAWCASSLPCRSPRASIAFMLSTGRAHFGHR